MTAAPSTACIDVAMVLYGNVDRIAARVEAVMDYPLVASVTAIDHGDDGSGAAAAAVGATVRNDATNPGFGSGMNNAASTGSAEFILLLNPDADLIGGALAAGLEALAQHPGAAAVQGLIRTEKSGELERSGGREASWIDLLGRATGAKKLLRFGPIRRIAGRSASVSHQVNRDTKVVAEVETIATTATLVRRAAFNAVSGFDENYFLYGEDLDLCRRLRERGYTLLYAPDDWAIHESGGSAENWWAREFRWWQGTMQFTAHWWSLGSFVAALGAASLMATRLSIHKPKRWVAVWTALVCRPLVQRVRRSAVQ